MPIDWQEIIKTLGGYTLFLGAAAWLIKQLVSNRFVRDAEKFKITVQTNADTEIERLKNSLQMAALEHQVRFSKLHERRAEIIAELYTRLVDAQEVSENYVSQGGGTQLYPAASRKLIEFGAFVMRHRIYLPERICTSLNTFLERVRKLVNIARFRGGDIPSEISVENLETLLKAIETFEREIPALRKALEDEFRKILGVERP